MSVIEENLLTQPNTNLIEENQRLRNELAEAYERLRTAQETIRKAKDINPVQRPSFKRVMLLARAACLTLQKISGGWLLKLGHLIRRFHTLKQVWEVLIADGFTISDLFPSPGEHWVKPRLRPRGVSIAPSAEYQRITYIPSPERVYAEFGEEPPSHIENPNVARIYKHSLADEIPF